MTEGPCSAMRRSPAFSGFACLASSVCAGAFHFLVRAVLLTALPFSAAADTTAPDLPAFLDPRHQASLRAFLSKNPHLELAPESLCACTNDLESLRRDQPSFQPYYAVGDINDDGIEDFAVGLLDKRRAGPDQPAMTLVIFNGPFLKGRPSRAHVVFKNHVITRPMEILSVFEARTEEGHRLPARLDLGPSPSGSDNNWRIFFDWKTRRYEVR